MSIESMQGNINHFPLFVDSQNKNFLPYSSNTQDSYQITQQQHQQIYNTSEMCKIEQIHFFEHLFFFLQQRN